jgi:hypothetical protein
MIKYIKTLLFGERIKSIYTFDEGIRTVGSHIDINEWYQHVQCSVRVPKYNQLKTN